LSKGVAEGVEAREEEEEAKRVEGEKAGMGGKKVGGWKTVDRQEGEKMVREEEEDLDGMPMEEEDVDGEPMEEDDDVVDGEPMEEDVDGDAMEEDSGDGNVGEQDTKKDDNHTGSQPSSDVAEGGSKAAEARRRRPKAVDMFADSDGE